MENFLFLLKLNKWNLIQISIIGIIGTMIIISIYSTAVQDKKSYLECTKNKEFNVCVDLETKCEYFNRGEYSYTLRVGSCKL